MTNGEHDAHQGDHGNARCAALHPDAVRLASAHGLGPATLRRLREARIDAQEILDQPPEMIAERIGCPVRTARVMRTQVEVVDAEAIMRRAAAAGAVLLDGRSAFWPPLIEALPDAPGFLWVCGDPSVLRLPGVAIVGSRRCSLSGRLQAERFAQRLGGSGLTIISGGARGIDASAHRGALSARAVTIAVLGCGVDIAYPPEHARLYAEILEAGGALVSEHPPGMPPRPGHFPRRNRIIAALALGTFVVEARERSGALVTARLTIEELGRDCWALPARCDDLGARGTLRLLQRGEAAMVLEPDEVLDAVRAGGELLLIGASAAFGVLSAPPGSRAAAAPSGAAEAKVMEALRTSGGADTESLVRLTGLSASAVQVAIVMLELSGRVAREATGDIVLRPGV